VIAMRAKRLMTIGLSIISLCSVGCDNWNSCRDTVFVLSDRGVVSCSRSDQQLVVLGNLARCYCPARGANTGDPSPGSSDREEVGEK
jgi:hypothetical protein